MVIRVHNIIIVLFSLIVMFLSKIVYAELIQNIPHQNQYFAGRITYLNDIQNKLAKYGIVYLAGYGGVGKTQIAKEFSHVSKTKYDIIWWFDLRNNLIVQYENLLTHLSNHGQFKNLLHIKIKDIPPGAAIDFTHSLLERSNCKWLLVFDNITSNKSPKLPKTEAMGKHVITVAREKQTLGDKVLTVIPFTDHESIQFLSKIHPKEEKGDIIKLNKILYNYPLALAQVSDEILIHQEGIKGYLKKLGTVNEANKKSVPITSSITQEYTNSYNEVLNNTVRELELKYEKAAEVLYMLALLKTNITKKLFNDFFGSELDDELVILNKYGVVQIEPGEKSLLLNIHDVIKEKVIERFNSKETGYKKAIINFLCDHLSNFYSENNFRYLVSLGSTSNQMAPLYAFIEEALQNDFINEEMINILIIALKLNDVLYNRHTDYLLYQRLANKIYNKNLDKISRLTKALLYASLIYSDFIFESKEDLLKFEGEYLRLLSLIENNKNNDKLFFVYTYLFKFYVMSGNLSTAEKFLKIAETKLNYTSNIFSLLQYWYTTMWFHYLRRNITEGMKAFNVYEKFVNQLPSEETNRTSLRNFRIKLGVFGNQKDKTKKEIEEAIKKAAIYYNNNTSTAVGNLEFTNALLYFQNNQYDDALIHASRSLTILNKDPGDMKSGIHGDLYLMLGKIYEKRANFSLALKNYEKCLKFHDRHSYGRALNTCVYGELLSALSAFYYKQKNYLKSKFYFQKLVSNFGLDHKVVEELIKTLPIEYMRLTSPDESNQSNPTTT